jgi:hypothetical protein
MWFLVQKYTSNESHCFVYENNGMGFGRIVFFRHSPSRTSALPILKRLCEPFKHFGRAEAMSEYLAVD